MTRTASIQRKTNETNIELELNIDGSGQSKLETGVPFLKHMLDLFAKHGQFDLTVNANGDKMWMTIIQQRILPSALVLF